MRKVTKKYDKTPSFASIYTKEGVFKGVLLLPDVYWLISQSIGLILFDDEECIVFEYALSDFDADGSYLAAFLGFDIVGHLHGFEHEHGISGVDLVSNIYVDGCDGARQGCLCGVSCVGVGGGASV